MPGNCYEVAAQLVIFDPAYADATLCHGTVWHDDTGWHGHAWVEVERTLHHPDWPHPITIRDCVDKANGNDRTLPAALYYTFGRIDPDTVERYDADEARICAMAADHWGPWHDDGVGR